MMSCSVLVTESIILQQTLWFAVAAYLAFPINRINQLTKEQRESRINSTSFHIFL